MENTEKPRNLQSTELYMKALCLSPTLENDSLRILPASYGDISRWSHGEVKKPDTVSYRTFRDVPEGIFCERIFGPERDWECYCGNYKGIKYNGISCKRCGVKVAQSCVRTERMGHIELAEGVVHPYFHDYLADTLGISPDDAKVAIYYRKCDDSKMKELKRRIRHENKSDWMFLKRIPVLPAGLRPMVYRKKENAFFTSDLNTLYRDLITINKRLKLQKELGASARTVNLGRYSLQKAVDYLFWNGYSGTRCVKEEDGKRELISLTDCLMHELRMFWKKHCDYSGTAIAVPDPAMGKNNCGLPINMLMELYRSLVVRQLKTSGVTDSLKTAKKMTKGYETDEKLVEPVIGALEKAITSRPLLLTYGTRATALWPKMSEYEAIAMHPDTCAALGLALDGKKVNLHMPIAEDAVQEAKSLVGKVVEGNGKIESTFSSLVANASIRPLIDAVVEGRTLPLSELEKYMFSRTGAL